MFEDLKTDWMVLRDNPPGQRFKARYRYRKHESPPPAGKRMFKIILGASLLPAGVLLWFIPGPGWLTIFVGLALLAGESEGLSRFLDRSEMAARNIIMRIRSLWRGD